MANLLYQIITCYSCKHIRRLEGEEAWDYGECMLTNFVRALHLARETCDKWEEKDIAPELPKGKRHFSSISGNS